MGELIDLAIPFIIIIIIGSIVDSLTKMLEFIIHKIPNLPDEFEWYIGYAIVFTFSFFIASNGGFNFFEYFGLVFKDVWVGHVLTAFVISGGSNFIKNQFALLENLPSIVFDFKSFVRKK